MVTKDYVIPTAAHHFHVQGRGVKTTRHFFNKNRIKIANVSGLIQGTNFEKVVGVLQRSRHQLLVDQMVERLNIRGLKPDGSTAAVLNEQLEDAKRLQESSGKKVVL